MNGYRVYVKFLLLMSFLFIPILFFGVTLQETPSVKKAQISKTLSRKKIQNSSIHETAQNENPTPIKISQSGATSSTPQIAVDPSGIAYVIWVEGAGSRHISFNTNETGSWGEPRNASSGIRIGASGPWPDATIDNAGRFHYVITAVSPFPNYEIYHAQYSDQNWQTGQNISHTATHDTGGSAGPTIAVNPNNNHCYAVWYDDFNNPDRWNLYLARQGSDGWSGSRMLPFSTGTYTPEIDVDGSGKAHLIWIRRGGGSIVWYARSSPNDVLNWTAPVTVSNQSHEDFCRPDLAVDNQGNVHVVWQQNKNSNREIYARSNINGSWRAIQNISNTSGSSQFPRITVNKDNGNVYVVWQERKNGKWQIYFNNSQGGEWSTPVDITDNSSQSISPTIAVDSSDNIHVVYSDNSSGGYNIWYVTTSDIGEIINVLYAPVNVHIRTTLDGEPDKKKNIVTWKKNPANDNETVKSYKIYRKKASQGASSYTLLKKVDKSTFKFEDGALSVNYKYSYVTTTINHDDEESNYSNEVSEPLVYPPVSLSTESALDDTKTKKINIITWKRNPRNNSTIKNYKIYRKEGGEAAYKNIKTVSGSVYSYQDKNLPIGKKYVYRLSAVDKNNRECEPSFSTHEDYVFPPINMNLRTIQNEGMYFKEKINRMKWKRNPLNNPVNVAKYVIYRKKAEENKTSYVRVFEDIEKAFEFWDRNLPLDVKYSYALTSVCENRAESKLSNSRVEK